MIVKATDEYEKAVKSIRDRRAIVKISVRIHRLANGNAGDARSVGKGVSELRIDYGPGYRVYYTQAGAEILLLLTCGDKSTQDRDIVIAKRLKDDYE